MSGYPQSMAQATVTNLLAERMQRLRRERLIDQAVRREALRRSRHWPKKVLAGWLSVRPNQSAMTNIRLEFARLSGTAPPT